MLKYLLAYEFGRTFPRFVLGTVLVFFGLIACLMFASAVSYSAHPFHYEKDKNGLGWVEVPGKMEWPTDRTLAERKGK